MQQDGGPYFASAGDDIKLWDPSKLQIIKQYNFHKGNVKDLSWSSDNSYICSTASGGDKIVLADCSPSKYEKAKVIAEHAIGEHQTCVRVSLTGRKLYSGGVDGAVFVWDRESGKTKKVYKETHANPITCIALNASETHIASGSNKGDVIIRNLSSDVTTKPDNVGNGQAVRGMTFSPWKHSLLGMTMDDGSLSLWDTLQGKSYHHFTQIHSAPAMDLAFSPFNDLLLASVGLDKHLMVFDVKRHKYLNKVRADQPLTSLTFLHDGYSIFAGTSLGRVYHYDLRHFSAAVQSVQAHSSTVQRLALHNNIKARKVHSRSSRSERSRDSASDDVIGKRKKVSQTGERSPVATIDGRGDYFQRGKVVTSSTRSTSSEGTDSYKPATNGYHNGTKQPKPIENSTPTTTLTPNFPPHADDFGMLISPLREEVFDDITMTSVDGSVLHQDPSMMRATFSSSVDTIGSYCDDILSPVSSLPMSNKGRISAATQIHSKTSPHPLRQSYGAQPTDKIDSTPNLRNSAPAPSFQALSAKVRAEAASRDSPDVLRKQGEAASNQRSEKLASLPPRSPVVVKLTQTGPEPLDQAPSSSAPTGPISPLPPAAPGRTADASGFQYQAEYLRNTVKEMVDELGDDLRRQINGVLNAMVKLSLQQEEHFERRLNERPCGVNEQILRECQRLREENERLKKKCS